MPHSARVYHSLAQLLEDCVGPRATFTPYRKSYEESVHFWTRKWNRHIEKHGNVPYLIKCAVCSGQEMRHMIKTGKWKVSTRKPKESHDQDGGDPDSGA